MRVDIDLYARTSKTKYAVVKVRVEPTLEIAVENGVPDTTFVHTFND